MYDQRQRFFIADTPVRGDVVHLDHALRTILAQRDYPDAIALLLGEMLTAVALLASTLKIEGRLTIQSQGSGPLKWAMAECHLPGQLRALAEWEEGTEFAPATNSEVALTALQGGVLFITIEPEKGERYQGIVPMDQPTLAACLTQYYDLSAQMPSHLTLACTRERSAGLLMQLLPRQEDEKATIDDDLWPRLTTLADTLTAEELLNLPATEILYRLYHEETVRLADAEPLHFGCTCSQQRCEAALQQIGADAVRELLEEEDEIRMDCQFCHAQYRFGPEAALALFGLHMS